MLLQSETFLNLFLMTITSIEELSSLLSRNISQFLSPLLLICQTPDPVLKCLILADLIVKEHLLIMHFDTSQDSWRFSITSSSENLTFC